MRKHLDVAALIILTVALLIRSALPGSTFTPNPFRMDPSGAQIWTSPMPSMDGVLDGLHFR